MIKTKHGYVLREIAGHHVVFPAGVRTVEFTGIITLNGSGVFIWENMAAETTEEELVDKFTAEYNVDEKTARRDIQEFIAVLKDNNLLDQAQ